MAGLVGNNAWWMVKKQSAKGTPATLEAAELTAGVGNEKQKAFKLPFAGGDISPNRVFGQLAETDSSRDQGVSYAKVGGVQGNPEAYVRDRSVGLLLTLALGADAVTGGAGKWVHKITPTTTLPYATVWAAVAEKLFEKYTDCMVSSVNIKSTAGEPLQIAANVIGVKTLREETDPTTTVKIPVEAGTVYNYNNAAVELSGGVTHQIGSFDLTINNNVVSQQTDTFTPLDVIPGQRQIDLTFDLLFETLVEYEKFNYGNFGAASERTAESSALYSTAASFVFSLGADNSIGFAVPAIAYESFPIAPNTSGAPIIATVKAVAQRATPIITATVKNQIEAY